MEQFKIAILSGKGGTGKTFIAVNLASVITNGCYIDCDVEEPNGNLFFKSNDDEEQIVTVDIPIIHRELCNNCRICSDFCQYNALFFLMDRILVIENLCHSCGGCQLLCPQHAIQYTKKTIGSIKKGTTNSGRIMTGILHPTYPTGIPILKELFSQVNQNTTILDCPPGTGCSVIECVKYSDFCLLVAEDSLFGLHNLKMTYELVKLFHKPHAILINKFISESFIESFCTKENIPIIDRIPFNWKIASLLSQGKILVHEDIQYAKVFQKYLNKIEEIYHEETSHS
ncbi:MAG: ATPase [Bacilli bacterium]|nr:ATPase [Bacilli bacterium]